MKAKNYLDTQPVKDWTIAKDVEHIFLGTIEIKQRWERINAKEQPIQLTTVPNLKPFNLHLN